MIVEQNSNLNFYATFVTHEGVEAVISGTPMISVFHRQGVITSEDFTNQDMTLLSGTTYYYTWRPTARAYKGTYVARYTAIYSGASSVLDVVGDESFQIVNRDFYDNIAGGFVNRGARSKNIWTESEKEQALASLLKIVGKVEDLEAQSSAIDGVLNEKQESLDKLGNNLIEVASKQQEKFSEISASIERLHEKEIVFPEIPVYKESIVINEVKRLNGLINEFKDMNKELRIPMIISELEDLKLGVENFQSDLCKVLPLAALKKGVGLHEET